MKYLLTVGLIVSSLFSTRADTLTCAPSQGGIEAEIVITGQDFGEKKGKVKLGGEPCLVRSWTSDSITVRTPRKLDASEESFALQVVERDGEESVLEDAFTLIGMSLAEAPSVPCDYTTIPSGTICSVAGTFGGHRRTFTLTGEGFGGKKAKVFVSGPDGKEKLCKVRSWQEDAIECIVPKGMEEYETLSVRIENKQESISHKDLVIMDSQAQRLGAPAIWTSSSKSSGDTQVVHYKGHRIRFYGWEDRDSVFELDDQGVEGIKIYYPQGNHYVLEMADLWPVVMDDYLYVFFRLEKQSNQLRCIQLDSSTDVTNAKTYKWRECSLEPFYSDTDFIPVYDQQNHQLYMFTRGTHLTVLRTKIDAYFHRSRTLPRWTDSGIVSLRKSTNGVESVSPIERPLYDPGVCLALNPKTNTTQPLVTWRRDNELCYGFLETGTDQFIIDSFGVINDPNASPTHLKSCGGGTAAMTYIGTDIKLRLYGFFPENYGKKELWQSMPVLLSGIALNQNRPPRLAIEMGKVGNQMNISLWVYASVGSRVYGFLVANIGQVTVDKVGENVAWATFSPAEKTAKKGTALEWYYQLPLLGVIEGGPPVCNSQDPSKDKKSRIVFSSSSAKSQTWEFTGKGGVFAAKDPPQTLGFTGELHAGFSGAYATEIVTTVGQEIEISSAKQDETEVIGLFMVPTTQTTTLNWSMGWGSPRTETFMQINVVGMDIHALPIPRSEFSAGFPMTRTYGLPSSYRDTPSTDGNGYLSFRKPLSTNWISGRGSSKLDMGRQITQTDSFGAYWNFKIGMGMRDVCSVGVEGDFTASCTLRETKNTRIEAFIENNDASKANDVEAATYLVYWYNTRSDAPSDCYWVPKGRSSQGDEPFYITHQLTVKKFKP